MVLNSADRIARTRRAPGRGRFPQILNFLATLVSRMHFSFEPQPVRNLNITTSHYMIQNKDTGEVVTKGMNAQEGAAGTATTGQNPQQPGAPAEGPSLLGMMWPLLIMFGLMYFLVMRPEKKRQKQATEMRSSLSKGDKVLLTGGMLGKIAGMADDWITVEISDGVRVQFQKSAVVSVIDAKDKADAGATAKS